VSEVYYFPENHLIVAYESDGFGNEDRIAGLFMTHAGETFTKDELLSYFSGVQATYLIATEIPETEGLTMNNFHSLLSELIEDLADNNLDNIDIRYYIPRTLH
jgi:hypothetical protein